MRPISPDRVGEQVEAEGQEPQAVAPPGTRRQWVKLGLIAAVVVLAVGTLGGGFGRDPSVVESVLLEGPAPPLAGATLDGGSFDIADHRGQVVLVNVWASWCAPCREEYPVLKDAERELSPLGLQVVGINTQDRADNAQAFLDELGGQTFPNVVDQDARHAVEWGTFGVPETFVVDRDGQLVAKRVGPIDAGWITRNVVPLLGQGRGAPTPVEEVGTP